MIGLTGGIASGKSVVASRLEALGAQLIDADAVAREVVEPGTPGLLRIVESFGDRMLLADGRLDRAGLGAVVFNNPERLDVLNGIVHPLVRDRTVAMIAAAPSDAVVVQDIPLLVETGQGAAFHLVLVVDAPDELRVRRMVERRGMTTAEARSRMNAQASRDERLAAADVVLDNSGSFDRLLDAVDELWEWRIFPYAWNLKREVPAARLGGPLLAKSNPDWPRLAARLTARLKATAPDEILAVEHIGSTSVPGLDAKDVIDLQLTVADLDTADRIAPVVAAAGFPGVPGRGQDTPKPAGAAKQAWQKRFHANADPARPVNVHVRVQGSTGWRYALLFRDWLRAEQTALELYAAEKHRLAALYSASPDTADYAEAKEPWFTEVAWPLMDAWAERTGWTPTVD